MTVHKIHERFAKKKPEGNPLARIHADKLTKKKMFRRLIFPSLCPKFVVGFILNKEYFTHYVLKCSLTVLTLTCPVFRCLNFSIQLNKINMRFGVCGLS